MLNDLREYIMDSKFKIIYFENKLNVVNYTKIDEVKNDRIKISYKDGSINIFGVKLSIIKLLKDEVLISGKIDKVLINEQI